MVYGRYNISVYGSGGFSKPMRFHGDLGIRDLVWKPPQNGEYDK